MKATIRRSLGVESTDCSDTEVLAAYAAVHTEVDGLIKQAEAQANRASALLQGESAAITGPVEQFPLSKRDIAGIAGQVLLDIRVSVEQQRICRVSSSNVCARWQSRSETRDIRCIGG